MSKYFAAKAHLLIKLKTNINYHSKGPEMNKNCESMDRQIVADHL